MSIFVLNKPKVELKKIIKSQYSTTFNFYKPHFNFFSDKSQPKSHNFQKQIIQNFSTNSEDHQFISSQTVSKQSSSEQNKTPKKDIKNEIINLLINKINLNSQCKKSQLRQTNFQQKRLKKPSPYIKRVIQTKKMQGQQFAMKYKRKNINQLKVQRLEPNYQSIRFYKNQNTNQNKKKSFSKSQINQTLNRSFGIFQKNVMILSNFQERCVSLRQEKRLSQTLGLPKISSPPSKKQSQTLQIKSQYNNKSVKNDLYAWSPRQQMDLMPIVEYLKDYHIKQKRNKRTSKKKFMKSLTQ